jgi:hypothetical protein
MAPPSLRFVLAALVALVTSSIAGPSAREPGLPPLDRIRIAEGQRIASELGDKLWPGWSEAPFAILLVTKEKEYLIGHSRPSDDFVSLGYDSLLQSDVLVRDRTYAPTLLATFPFQGVPTIVIGQPKNTEAAHSTRWVMTLLHEHFHQWQMSQPDYYDAVNDLGLAGDDKTGMWMLDYPFAYEDKETNFVFRELCGRLREAAKGVGASMSQTQAYLAARERFHDVLSDADYRYFSFQVWQEGLARYTEYKLARSAEVAYRPSPEFEAIPDFVPFGETAEAMRRFVLDELSRMSLKDSKRMAFYHVGAAEGELLDRANPGWRDRYNSDRFYVDRYFERD